MLSTVIHPNVMNFLRSDESKIYQALTWKCIDKLRNQKFDNGLRVKKLKGISFNIREARLDKCVRLIFSFKNSKDSSTGCQKTYLALQEVCFDHDDVARKARKYTDYSVYKDLDDFINELCGDDSCRQQNENDKEEYFNFSYDIEFEEETNEAYDELIGNIQWRIVSSQDAWNRSIENKDIDLPLRLTPEEWKYSQHESNLLLSGSAGSGKTTVGLYRLLLTLTKARKKSVLYVTRSYSLVHSSKEIFSKLISSSEISISRSKLNYEFKSFNDLCKDLLIGNGIIYTNSDYFEYQRFLSFYQKLPYVNRPVPVVLAWEEIYRNIKGALSRDYSNEISQMLSKEEYCNYLSYNRSPISLIDREKIYAIYEIYQHKLAQDKKVDELDLVNLAISNIFNSDRLNTIKKYDVIVCDEAQDLTDKHIFLLEKILKRQGHIFIAGDENQTISPGVFSWKRAAQIFREADRLINDLERLQSNFRNTSSLIQLSQKILNIRNSLCKGEVFHEKLLHKPYEKFESTSARLIRISREEIIHILGDANPNEAIIVRSELDREWIKTIIPDFLVFTIEEVKGQEFETVYLFNFFDENRDLWNKGLDEKRREYLSDGEKSILESEFNRLYVCITRAQKFLLIWDEHPFDFWIREDIIDFISQVNDPIELKKEIPNISADAWRHRALVLKEKGYLEDSRKCFIKAGDINLSQEVESLILISQSKYDAAIEILSELGKYADIAGIFQTLGKWKEALESWSKCSNLSKSEKIQKEICEIRLLEKENRWREAEKKWLSINNREEANRCRKQLEITQEEKTGKKSSSLNNVSSRRSRNNFQETIVNVFPIEDAIYTFPWDLDKLSKTLMSWGHEFIAKENKVIQKSFNDFKRSRIYKLNKKFKEIDSIEKYCSNLSTEYRKFSEISKNKKDDHIRIIIDKNDDFAAVFYSENEFHEDSVTLSFCINPIYLLDEELLKLAWKYLVAEFSYPMASNCFIGSAKLLDKLSFSLTTESLYSIKGITSNLDIYHIHGLVFEDLHSQRWIEVPFSSKNTNVEDSLRKVASYCPSYEYLSCDCVQSHLSYYMDSQGNITRHSAG